MKKFFSKNKPLIFLALASLLAHFLFLGYPSEVVFDEVHFGKFSGAYFSHEYYFDIHPPLGKLMVAAFADLSGIDFLTGFNQIGEQTDTKTLSLLRFMPAFFGFAFVLLVYALALALGLSKKSAFLAGFLVLFDNALLGQSKFILMDIFLLVFGFAALLFFILSRKKRAGRGEFLFLVIAGFFAGLSLSVKWTGLSFLCVVLFFSTIDSLRPFRVRRLFAKTGVVLAASFLVYISAFAIHFRILDKPGPGDAFMSKEFNSGQLSFFGKFKELNIAMYKYNAGLKAGHPDASKWNQWIFDKKPVWYWSKNVEGKPANIYLLGNPVVWWSSTLAAALSVLLIFFRKRRDWLAWFLLIGYFANLLPFIFVSRAAFLYHYLAALVFAILILTFLRDSFLKNSKFKKAEKFLYPLFLAAVFAAFIYLAPLTYGLPVSEAKYSVFQSIIDFFKI